MKYSGIGGQSVMEGVMMRNGRKYAVAVRRPDHEIEVKVENDKAFLFDDKWNKVPLVRGVLSFIDSLVLGMSTLMYSASFFEDEEEEETERQKAQRQKKESAAQEDSVSEGDVFAAGPKTEREKADKEKTEGEKADKEKAKTKKADNEKEQKKQERAEKALMGGTLVFSVVLAVAIFMILPYYLSQTFQRFVTDNANLVAIFEGILRLVIFIGYIVLISRMNDIQRVFMYHGAEHKCINCIENGLDLNVENVRKSSKEHKRCGTSFMVFVIVISIILYLFIRVDSHALRIVIRLLLIPVIAGLSYEFIRLAGRSDNRVIQILSKPGFWMQSLTVKEPDDEMIEVGIASVEAVFDWKPFVEEVRREEGE
ncbi:MAG: DUF1385 domain-containing protein [Lachnospiraceae bacterium]|nr:DUF1385 domain-containing protein [Lachnospiraceae bacterium]